MRLYSLEEAERILTEEYRIQEFSEYTVMVFIFLAYFTLYNGLQFHPSHQN